MHSFRAGNYVVTVIPGHSKSEQDEIRRLRDKLEEHQERDRMRFERMESREWHPAYPTRPNPRRRTWEARDEAEGSDAADEEYYPEVQPHREKSRYRSRSEVAPVDDYSRSRSVLGDEGRGEGRSENAR